MTLAAPVTIATPRLVLRAPCADDAQAVFDAYSSDPRVTRFLGWPTHDRVERAREFLERCAAVRAAGTAYPWAITRDGRLIGMIEARVDGHRAEIGYALAHAAWGRGYTTEAARAVVEWAWSQRAIQRVWAFTDLENGASARVLENTGMTREGTLRAWFVPTGFGVPRDCLVYARAKAAGHRVAETRATLAAAVAATPSAPPSRRHETVRIETPRLVLRPPTVDDAPTVFGAYAQDPAVARYTSWAPHRSVDTTREFLLLCEEGWTRGTVCSWAITRRDDGTMLGTTDLRLEGHRGEMGYALARAAWGRGYATETARAVIAWAHTRRALRRVWAVCDVENAASARVLEKAGMTREACLRAWAAMPAFDAPRDVWCYAAIKDAA